MALDFAYRVKGGFSLGSASEERRNVESRLGRRQSGRCSIYRSMGNNWQKGYLEQ